MAFWHAAAQGHGWDYAKSQFKQGAAEAGQATKEWLGKVGMSISLGAAQTLSMTIDPETGEIGIFSPGHNPTPEYLAKMPQPQNRTERVGADVTEILLTAAPLLVKAIPKSEGAGVRPGAPPTRNLSQGQKAGILKEPMAAADPPAAEPAVPLGARAGETEATAGGKSFHREMATTRRAEREASGAFDLVNEPIMEKTGEPILVPKRVNLKTGERQPGSALQEAVPDAVSFKRKAIVDDKPLGRPLSKDRQEIIRFLEAYRKREGEYPSTIEIPRYDPQTMKVVKTDTYKPEDFLPKASADPKAVGK